MGFQLDLNRNGILNLANLKNDQVGSHGHVAFIRLRGRTVMSC